MMTYLLSLQYLMGLCLRSSSTPTIAMILNLVSRLGPEEQKELLQRIQEIVVG